MKKALITGHFTRAFSHAYRNNHFLTKGVSMSKKEQGHRCLSAIFFPFATALFIIILLSPHLQVRAAETMPTFSEEDFLDCTIAGMKLDYAVHQETETYTGISGEYWDEKGIPQEPATSFIRFTGYYYLNAEEASSNYQLETAYAKEYCQGGDPVRKILKCDVLDNETAIISSDGGYYYISYYMIYDSHYYFYFEIELHPPATEQQMWDMFNQTKDCMLKVINSKDRKLRGIVTNAWGEFLPLMVVKLNYNGKEYETTTGEDGSYQFPFSGPFGRKAKLSLVMQCRDDQTTYFTIVSDVRQKIPHTVIHEFTIQNDNDLKHDAIVEDTKTGTEYLGDLYRDMVMATAFYVEELKVQPEPCLIRPYSSGKTLYAPQELGIQISDADTGYKEYSAWRSPYIEYHEYAHHIMYCMYGKKFPAPPPGATPEERNHAGYINPSTSDSLVEGFADFMTAVIVRYYAAKSLSAPNTSYANDINTRAWDGCGFAEEEAVSGVLWDLYDVTNPLDGDNIQLSMEEIWAVLKTYRANMYEVYKGFIETYPAKKPQIEQIFINHGFFADKNEGNKIYDFREPVWGRAADGEFYDLANPVQRDIGETIGQATNYQRPERYSKEPWPNHFIKTGDAYPFFKVTFTFPEHPYLDYDLHQEQQNGLIYVPVPPDIYQADIKIEGFGDGITTGTPLSFTNQEFISSYETIIAQGFYREHDFEITGTMPVRPRTDPRRKGVCPAQRVLEGSARELEILRRFRDETLEGSALGELCIRLYYDHGETIIGLLDNRPYLKKAAAVLLEKAAPAIEMTLK